MHVKDFEQSIPYGTGQLTVRIPRQNYLGTLMPTYPSGVADEAAELRRALQSPIGTPTLRDIVAQKTGTRTVVVVNDGSRPTATAKLLPPLMQELNRCGVADADILILIATGTHRDMTPQECESVFGREIAARFRIVNHHCQGVDNMVDLGTTSQGIPVLINRRYCEADIRILTGSIHPHQGAGFSGGRKSILPGLTSLASLKLHHGHKFRPAQPAMGWLEGNPFHLAALEAARKAEPDFILNLVQNSHKEIIRAVAGDLEAAWLAGVQASRAIFETDTPKDVDIVVAVPGGHPRDTNLYQSQKTMAAAELVVKPGGTIILPAACPEGVGADLFYEWIASASCLEDVGDRFRREGFSIGTSKAWLYSRCLLKAELILVSDCLDAETVQRMFARKAPDMDTAVDMALATQGPDAKILFMQNAADMIPRCGAGDDSQPGA